MSQPRYKKPTIRKIDAQKLDINTIEDYQLNDFPNRQARRAEAKRMGIVKRGQWGEYNNNYKSDGDNKQTIVSK